MYPAPQVLQELGRVTIAGARLDLQTAFLLHHLEPAAVGLEDVRAKPGSWLSSEARKRAERLLEGELLSAALEVLESADEARRLRNEAVHQEWVLRGADGMRSVSDLPAVASEDEMRTYVDEWEREAKPSPSWLRVPARSLALEEAQTLEQLVEVERRIGAALARVVELTFLIASARDAGSPPGYRGAASAVAPESP